jgi:hypothetical protein
MNKASKNYILFSKSQKKRPVKGSRLAKLQISLQDKQGERLPFM